jgi:hypothetical protein
MKLLPLLPTILNSKFYILNALKHETFTSLTHHSKFYILNSTF